MAVVDGASGAVVAPTPDERQRLEALGRLLERAAAEAGGAEPELLVGGERIAVPAAVLRAVLGVLRALHQGETATIVPGHAYLTTQQAAVLLGVSRQYLVRLLDRDELPHVKTGTHRRVLAADLLRYQQQRDARRRVALDRLAALSEDLGLYESTTAPVAWQRLDAPAGGTAGTRGARAATRPTQPGRRDVADAAPGDAGGR